MRKRIYEIEQYWSTYDVENGTDTPSAFLTAFSLSSEQLVLCQRLNFNPGIITYIILHNVEASSGVLADLQNEDQANTKEVETMVLVNHHIYNVQFIVFKFYKYITLIYN